MGTAIAHASLAQQTATNNGDIALLLKGNKERIGGLQREMQQIRSDINAQFGQLRAELMAKIEDVCSDKTSTQSHSQRPSTSAHEVQMSALSSNDSFLLPKFDFNPNGVQRSAVSGGQHNAQQIVYVTN